MTSVPTQWIKRTVWTIPMMILSAMLPAHAEDNAQTCMIPDASLYELYYSHAVPQHQTAHYDQAICLLTHIVNAPAVNDPMKRRATVLRAHTYGALGEKDRALDDYATVEKSIAKLCSKRSGQPTAMMNTWKCASYVRWGDAAKAETACTQASEFQLYGDYAPDLTVLQGQIATLKNDGAF